MSDSPFRFIFSFSLCSPSCVFVIFDPSTAQYFWTRMPRTSSPSSSPTSGMPRLTTPFSTSKQGTTRARTTLLIRQRRRTLRQLRWEMPARAKCQGAAPTSGTRITVRVVLVAKMVRTPSRRRSRMPLSPINNRARRPTRTSSARAPYHS